MYRSECDACGLRLRPHDQRQLRQSPHRSTTQYPTARDFAVCDVACAQVQPYASHDRPPLGPHHYLWLRPRGGVDSFGHRREVGHFFQRPSDGAPAAAGTLNRSRGCRGCDVRRTKRLACRRFIPSTSRRPPGGGDVKGKSLRSRRSPHIGRSGCQVARTVWCAVTDYASGLRRNAGRDVVAGDERCAGKWRIEADANVPEKQGINLLVGPRGPWLQWVLRGRIT